METNLVEDIGDLFQTIYNAVQYFRILHVSFQGDRRPLRVLHAQCAPYLGGLIS